MPPFVTRFLQDPLANSIAVIVLLALLYGLGRSMLLYYRGEPLPYRFASWWIAALALAGMGVAFYMTYVEVNHVEAICGPVGNCNTVQQSRYATLMGGIPVGLFGLLGYAAVLLGWAAQSRAPQRLRPTAALLLWGLLVFGNLFSAYLTFLEPFVIGATCVWCITSALLMLALLWLETPLLLELTQAADE